MENESNSEKRRSKYRLHESIFHGNFADFKARLSDENVNEKDTHGNTPLHLAVMLGRRDFINELLKKNAPVKIKNTEGWTPLEEAISYGDRSTIKTLLMSYKQQSRAHLKDRRPKLAKMLKEVKDFYLELKWDFQSWIPLVSRILPSDICRITKMGSSIRVDTTLVDFNDMKWERGDICFIFKGDADPTDSLIVLDNKKKVFQRARNEETEVEIEDEVDLLMSSDIVTTRMSTKPIVFERARSGWLFPEDKSETVGKYQCDFYLIHGMILGSRKRREHLTDEDIRKNKAFVENLTKIGNPGMETQLEQRRRSLSPPPRPSITWEEYLKDDRGKPPHLGRPIKQKNTSKAFKATLAMSKDFPLNMDLLFNLLELTPFKHVNKLRDLVRLKLPEGFPVKIDIPILPTVSAKITFQEFTFLQDVDANKFEIPDDYREDPTRFPDL